MYELIGNVWVALKAQLYQELITVEPTLLLTLDYTCQDTMKVLVSGQYFSWENANRHDVYYIKYILL